MKIPIPQTLYDNLDHAEGKAWLATLPDLVSEVATRWSLTLGEPFGAEASCSWVAPCTRADGSDAVLKLGWLHMEAEDEIEALHFLDGDPTAYLLEADKTINAMLLERCQPGTVLRELAEEAQDEILAGVMWRLWRKPVKPFCLPEKSHTHLNNASTSTSLSASTSTSLSTGTSNPLDADTGENFLGEMRMFRPLEEMITLYISEAEERSDQWLDPAIAQAGIQVYRSLIESTTDHVLLATDLHAGNVLRAQREPWLMIDPKPFVGDPAYDATQHLFNCWERMQADPLGAIERFASLLDLDAERVRMWCFARLATMGAGDPHERLRLARKLAP